MIKYSEKVIEEIKSKLKLSEVVGEYVQLKRQGRSDDYKACCPFHQEKTPSFVVHDDKGFYKCFGCNKGGNIFTFLMEIEHFSFSQAVESLAKRAHVELKQETEEEKARHSKEDALADIYNRICISFNYILMNGENAEYAKEYLKKRGIDDATCKKFLLGYAPNDPTWLYKFLKEKKYSDELISESGLFSKRNGKLPLFRNRLLFPIRTWQGNCVAFSGRDLNKDSKVKYINSPETSIYSKRNVLYGFYEGLSEIRKKEEIVLCEGNFDVISLHQAGICNACAPLGTAFTQEQVSLIKRYCNKVKLLFDSDAAGQNATKKAIFLCQKNNLECFVVKPFKNAKDASQVLEEQGVEILKRSLDNVDTSFEYLVYSAIKMYDISTPKGKLSVFKEVCPYLDVTSSEIERQGYVKYLSEILRVPEKEVVNDYGKYRNKFAEKQESVQDKERPLKLSTELYVLLLILNNKQYFEYFRKKLKISDLKDPNAKILYTILEDCKREERVSEEAILSSISDGALKNFVFNSFSEKQYKTDNTKETIDEAVNAIKLQLLCEKRKKIIGLINSGEAEKFTPDEYRELLEVKSNLDREIEELKR